MTIICLYCKEECEVNVESGTFDAHGPAGTIKGDLGDLEVSDCCSERTEEIDSELWEYFSEIKRIAKEQDCLNLISNNPEDYLQSFNEGIEEEDVVDILSLKF